MMMAQYSRQTNSDTEEMEERPMSPTSEVLHESAGGAVRFVTPGLKYRVRSTSFWGGRTKLERCLAIVLLGSLVVCLVLVLVMVVASQADSNYTIHLAHPNSSCKKSSKDPEERKTCLTPDCIKVAASLLNTADLTVNPCTDFYQYACGGWQKKNPIPDGKSSWSTFKKLWQENQNILRTILEKNMVSNLTKPASSGNSSGTSENSSETVEEKAATDPCTACTKARAYYQSCLDREGELEKLGGGPLIDILDNFTWNVPGFNKTNLQTNWSLENIILTIQHTYNVGGFFVWNVGEDDKNSSRHVLLLDQGGLSLDSRDQYLKKTEDNKKVLAALLEVMVQTTLFLFEDKKEQLGGNIPNINKEDVTRQMKEVIELETSLAEITIPASQQRDGETRYNKFTIRELQEEAGFLDWQKFFQHAFQPQGREISQAQEIVVYSPSFLANLTNIVREKERTEEGRNVLNNYMMWQIIKSFNQALSKKYRDVNKVLKKALTGADVHEERWRVCVTDVDEVIGFALGAMFVNETFKESTKPAAEMMIRKVTKAFKQGLVEARWMDNDTRTQAEIKAEKITNMIGYPDYIVDNTKLEQKYKNLTIGDDYFTNYLNWIKWVLSENLAKLDRPVKKDKWDMTPSTINAYYTPLKNQIVFPAGILQEPFFSITRPWSLNYGAMGVAMGHEVSHAFDDQGRQYDAEGNMRNWWKEDTLKAYKNKIKCIEQEYGNYTVQNGEHISGLQTLGENIADNGGLKASFRAYSQLSEGGSKDWNQGQLPGINLTNNQLFFLSFAQVWCELSTPQSEHLSVMEDAHSPPRLRVLGTLSNSEDFNREFNCEADSKMNQPKKCDVW